MCANERIFTYFRNRKFMPYLQFPCSPTGLALLFLISYLYSLSLPRRTLAPDSNTFTCLFGLKTTSQAVSEFLCAHH